MRLQMVIGIASHLTAAQLTAQELRDYSKLDHTISITSFRAGNHNPSGINSYYLKATQYALVNTKEERLKEFDQRKKTPSDEHTFGAIELESLSHWSPPEQAQGDTSLPFFAARITGDSIRKATAAMMLSEKLPEGQIAHVVIVELHSKMKKYFFLSEDQFVARTHYFPVPPSSFDGSERVNQNLQISDELGTLIRLSVNYDNPVQSVRPAAASPNAPQGQGQTSATLERKL